MNGEEWRDLPPNLKLSRYQVSSLGRFRKVDGEITTGTLTKDGYCTVNIVRDDTIGKNSTARLHRLVAQTFIPNPDNKPSVDHIDRVRSNNSVSNLHWCSQSENLKHAHTSGLNKTVNDRVVDQLHRETLEVIATFPSIAEASRKTGVHKGGICNTCNGKAQQSGGFKWRYHQ